MRSALLWGFAALLGGGCSPSFVEGSLGSLMDLHFEKVWVDRSSDEVGVRFAKPRGGDGAGEDTVLRVTVRLDGIELFENIEFDMAEALSSGSQRGTVSRDVLDDPTKNFPDIKTGVFRLRDVPGDPGTLVRGHFDVIFVNCTDFACGHTAFATFTGEVQ